MNDELLTLDQLATYLRLSKMSIYRMAQRGDIPATKIASQWRFRRGDIEKWLAMPGRVKTLEASPSPPDYPTGLDVSEFAREYKAAYREFQLSILRTSPDFFVPLERRAARLFDEWGEIPPWFAGRVCYEQAFEYMPDSELRNKYIAILNDSVQHAGSLRNLKDRLQGRGAIVNTFGLFGCRPFLEDSTLLNDPWVRVCFKLDPPEFMRATAHLTRHFMAQVRPPDVDHIMVKLILTGKKGRLSLAELLRCLSEFGDVFLVRSPAEEKKVLTITVDRPNLLSLGKLGLPEEIKIDGPFKIRLYWNLLSGECFCALIIYPTARLNPTSYFTSAQRPSSFLLNFRELVPDYDALAEDQKVKCCYTDLYINLSAMLLIEFLRRLNSRKSPVLAFVRQPPINHDDLQRCYGYERGDKIAKFVIESLQDAGVLQEISAKEQRFHQAPLFDASMNTLLHDASRSELLSVLDSMTVVRALTEYYDQVKATETDRLKRLEKGLTFTDLYQLLSTSMNKWQVSWAIDTHIDRTTICPFTIPVRDMEKAGYWEVSRRFRPGEGAPGVPPHQIGHGDSQALEPSLRWFRRDKYITPFIIDRLMKFCALPQGIEPFLLNKAIACLRLDWLQKQKGGEQSFWQSDAWDWGPLPVIPDSVLYAPERGGNLYQLAQHGGSYFELTSEVKKTKRGTEITKRYFIPIPGWEDVVEEYFRWEELSAIETCLKVYAKLFKQVYKGTATDAVDTLLALSTCYNEENTYRYAFANVKKWCASFENLIGLCQAQLDNLNVNTKLNEQVNYCKLLAESALYKIAKYRALPNVGAVLKTLSVQSDISERKVIQAIWGRCDGAPDISDRLINLERIADLTKEYTTLVKHLLSKMSAFGVADGKKDLDYYIGQASKKAKEVIRQGNFEEFKVDENALGLGDMKNLIKGPIDSYFQKIVTAFNMRCSCPDIPTDTDPMEIFRTASLIQRFLRERQQDAVLMFTDLRGATRHYSGKEPYDMAISLESYSFVRKIASFFRGEIEDTEGDGTFLTFGTLFGSSREAVLAGIRMLKEHSRKLENEPNILPMGIGLCKGSYIIKDMSQVGPQINWAKKLSGAKPPDLFITEDIADEIQSLDIPCVEVALDDVFNGQEAKVFRQKVYKVSWREVDVDKCI